MAAPTSTRPVSRRGGATYLPPLLLLLLLPPVFADGKMENSHAAAPSRRPGPSASRDVPPGAAGWVALTRGSRWGGREPPSCMRVSSANRSNGHHMRRSSGLAEGWHKTQRANQRHVSGVTTSS